MYFQSATCIEGKDGLGCIAIKRSIRSGIRDTERLAIRVHHPTVGVLSEPIHVARPRLHSMIKTAAHSTSELVICPFSFWTSVLIQSGH
jgi:hypothetical protein